MTQDEITIRLEQLKPGDSIRVFFAEGGFLPLKVKRLTRHFGDLLAVEAEGYRISRKDFANPWEVRVGDKLKQVAEIL